MANTFNDLSLITFKAETLRPQSFTTTGNGLAVDAATVGVNLLNALLAVGAVNTLTSFDVKIQASPDGTNSWVDIPGATFTQVVAANSLQMISFQLPKPLTVTADPYRYVRAVGTLVGTSVLVHCVILACLRYPNPTLAYANAPPTIN